MKKTNRLLCLLMCLILFLPILSHAEGDISLNDIVIATDDDEQWAQWEAQDAAASDTDEEAAALAFMEANQDSSVTIDSGELELNENLPTGILNILLLGIDSRKDVTDIGLSDAIMICSIDTTSGSIKLTSITRDTCVTLPGYKNQNRINTAYKFGGMAGEKAGIANGGPILAMRTVNHNFDMNIAYFVTVNIFGLAAIIDSMGGIDIELSKAEASRINYELRKEPMDKVKRTAVEKRDGIHHLDGMQAVTFARLRHATSSDNDFVRTSRQRKLIETVLSHALSDITLNKVTSLIEATLPHVYTNVPAGKILEIGMTILSSDILSRKNNGEELIAQHRIPMDGCFSYKDVNGSTMTYMNEKNFKLNKESIHKFIYGDVYPR